MTKLIIRQAEEKDVSAIAEIEKQCFTVPWSYASLHEDVTKNPHAWYLVAEIEGKVCGYVGIWRIVGEGHITNVAVAPAYRRRHIASAMLDVLLTVTTADGILCHTLEVRPSNAAAIALYTGKGFVAAGRRKGYYEDNGEDALIMWRET